MSQYNNNKKINLFFVYDNKTFSLALCHNDTFKLVKNKIVTILKKSNYSLKTQQLYFIHNNKIITNLNYKTILDKLNNNSTILVNHSVNGGFFMNFLEEIINALLSFLDPILSPLRDIIRTFISMILLLENLVGIFISVMKAIPTIFEPSKLIDDILYGISYGITKVFSGLFSSIDTEKNPQDKEPEDDDIDPFEVKKSKDDICVPPTLVNTLLLLLCPPLAIFIKHGMSGLISTIICGVLCVKLYYFPGLIFAALHVLCV